MSDPSVRADLAQEIKRITWRIIILHQVQSFIAALPLVYLVSLVMGLSSEQGMVVLKYLLPPLNTAIGMVGPVTTIYLVVKKALTPVPGESDAERLVRILKAPRRIEVLLEAQVTLGVFTFIAISCALFNLSLWAIPWGILVTMSLTMLVMVHVRLGIERVLRPHALALFQASPTQTLSASGPLWVRQSWFLPYTFGIFVFTSLTVTVTVIGSQVGAVFTQLSSQYGQLGNEQFGEVLRHGLGLVVQGSLVPMLALGAFLLINAGAAALQLARHQTEGASAVQSTIQALAAGTAKLPEWVTTDEIGDLSRATARVFDRLGNLSLSLADSARLLGQSAQKMGDSNVKQTEILTRQAAAIQETQVTTQEIKQTSLVASQKAESILLQTDRADQISRSGEAAVEQSLGGLQAIRDHVKEMESRIKALDERAKQIGKITTTVKDLADQSNMLALNAAIEAVRSGEHGKGFSVVAKEIRSLADQSIKATNNVRAILQDISSAIRTTVSITEQGALKVDESLTQVRASGENIRELSVIVRENAQAVRQISVAVTQQNAGIGQIFQAINDLSTQMTETMTRVRASDEAMELVGRVAQRVSGFVDTYGWSQVKGQQTTLASSELGLLADSSADSRPSSRDTGNY